MIALKIPYKQKQKKLSEVPEELQIIIKDLIVDHYSDQYDCDSNEMRSILYDFEEKSLNQILKEIS